MVKIHCAHLNLARVRRKRQIRKIGDYVEATGVVAAILAVVSLVSAPVLHSLPAVALAGAFGLAYILLMMLAMFLQSQE